MFSSIRRDESLDNDAGDSNTYRAEVVDSEMSPEEVVLMADELEQTLSVLDEEERQVVDYRLQNYKVDEIAEKLKCSDRTVRRILKRVRTRLEEILEVSVKDVL